MRNLFSYCYHKSRDVVRTEGAGLLVKKGVSKLKTFAYTTNEAPWFCRPLDRTFSRIDIPDVGIDIAQESEFEKWLQQHQAAFPWIYVEQEVIASRDDPRLAFVAKINNKIVGYLKIAIRNAYVLD